jgi:hypothetical protein
MTVSEVMKKQANGGLGNMRRGSFLGGSTGVASSRKYIITLSSYRQQSAAGEKSPVQARGSKFSAEGEIARFG